MIGGMFWDFAWRLLLAGVLGAVIGLDREYRAKEAGFRTHFLVALGSALFMIVSQYGFSGVLAGADVKLDPSRVAAQVVSGIGFLGAGTIIFQKQVVRGLTTAAGLWATAVGGGMYWVSVCATVLTLFGLEILTLLFKSVGIRNALFAFSTASREELKKISGEVLRRGHRVISYTTREEERDGHTLYRVTLVVRIRKQSDERSLFEFIQSLPDTMLELME